MFGMLLPSSMQGLQRNTNYTVTIRLAETVGVLPKEALFVVPRHASNGARSPGLQNAGEYGCLGVSDGLCR